VGYAEIDDANYQTAVLDPEMNAFVAVLGPRLVELLSDRSVSTVQRRCCKDALYKALKRRVIWEAHISTSYFLEAMRFTGLVSNHVPPRLPRRNSVYRIEDGGGPVPWWAM
jgi:hypothetical protein